MVCLSCLEVGVADVVDRWKVLEVDALLLGPMFGAIHSRGCQVCRKFPFV